MALPDYSSARLVVYDLDGTLVNAFGDIAAAANHALTSMGRQALPLSVVTGYVGHGVRNLMSRCLGGGADDAAVDEAVRWFADYARERPVVHAHVYDGCETVLRAVKARGGRQVVVSNKPDALTKKVGEILGLAALCDEIIGESPRFPRKPDPAVVADVLTRFGLSGAESVMVGDGDTDMQVGRALGMKTIGVTWGIHTGDQLRAWGADAVAESPDELNIILNGNGA